MSELNSKFSGWGRIEQWVSRVIGFSSEHERDDWAATEILGPPKVFPRYGNVGGVWAQGDRADEEFILLEFETVVYPEEIHIYETYNSGGVVEVLVRNGLLQSPWETIWKAEEPMLHDQARIFIVPVHHNLLTKQINQIRLNINCRAACDGCYIDCVQLIGFSSYIQSSFQDLRSDIELLISNDYFPDVTFVFEDGQTLRSYRNLLAARSVYFQDLFEAHPSGSNDPIPIDHLSSRCFEQILRFILTDRLDATINDEICLELMRCADEFHLSSIYKLALKILRKKIHAKNVLKILAQSSGLLVSSQIDNHREPVILNDVVQLCIDFIEKNRSDVFQPDQLRPFTKPILIKFAELVSMKSPFISSSSSVALKSSAFFYRIARN